jgi:peptidoglycan/xylan/chitin deacetylase (PgdA/CDA1 family)
LPDIDLSHFFAGRTKVIWTGFAAKWLTDLQPISLSALIESLREGKLPPNSLTITVDDGYRSYLEFGHEIFQRHKLPVTIYAVSGFADGRLWLWPDQVEYRCSIQR